MSRRRNKDALGSWGSVAAIVYVDEAGHDLIEFRRDLSRTAGGLVTSARRGGVRRRPTTRRDIANVIVLHEETETFYAGCKTCRDDGRAAYWFAIPDAEAVDAVDRLHADAQADGAKARRVRVVASGVAELPANVVVQ